MVRLLLCLSLCLLMAPDRIPRRRAIETGPLAAVEDHGNSLPDEPTMVGLAQTDPIEFLNWCLVRYDREVTGYRTVLRKQERIKGKLNLEEEIHVDFRERPFSVLFVYPREPRPGAAFCIPTTRIRARLLRCRGLASRAFWASSQLIPEATGRWKRRAFR